MTEKTKRSALELALQIKTNRWSLASSPARHHLNLRIREGILALDVTREPTISFLVSIRHYRLYLPS
jgi:hypothetical protein